MTEAVLHETLEAGPFKGLMPFDDSERDALLFFGRERERELISANLMASRLTVLYGESGVGKTSLLAAGVAQHLRGTIERNLAERSHPEFVVLIFSSWSEDPIAALRGASRQALGDVFGPAALSESAAPTSLVDELQSWTDELGCDLLLILDQVEDYFLYHDGEEGPGTFAEQLPALVTRAGLRVSVLLSIREDALAKLDRFKGRIPNLFGNYLRLDHLDREAARSAITGPIDQFNRFSAGEPIEAEPELVEAVLDETATGRVDLGQAGRGVVRGAETGARIEAPFLQLVLERLWGEEIRGGSRTLRLETFRRLGGAAEIVRNHLERALAALSPGQKDIAASLFNYLVTPSGTKIAHAAGDLAEYASVRQDELIPVLSTLVDERILRPAAARNGARASDGSPVEIFHDVLAESVIAWRTRYEAERELARERADAQRRHRRLLVVATLSLVAVVGMAAVTIFALMQRSEARSQTRRAQARELDAAAVSQLTVDPELSLLLAVHAARSSPTGQAEEVLRDALIASRATAVLPAGGPVVSAAYSPDGRSIVTASSNGSVRLFDAASHRLQRTLDAGVPLNGASFSPDGGSILTAGGGDTARLWDVRTGRLLRRFGHRGPVESAEFSSDGTEVVTASDDGTARIWSVAEGAPLRTLRHPGPVRQAELSRDGSLVLTVSSGTRARLFDARSGRLLHELDQGGELTAAAFSRGGRLVVTGGRNRIARVWNARTGLLLTELVGHAGQILDVGISPRGAVFVTASTDGTARVFDGRGDVVSVLYGHSNFVVTAAFSPDGESVVTASRDRTARLWKADGNPLAVLAGHGESLTGASFSPTGTTVLTSSEDGTARLWNPVVRPRLRLVRRFGAPVEDASVGRAGRVVAAAVGRTVFLLRRDTGEVIRRLESSSPVTAVAFSQDGELVATAAGRSATVWRVATGEALRRFAHDRAVTAVAFSPTEEWLATGGRDRAARVWSLGGTLLRTLPGHRGSIGAVAFDPTGRLLLTGSSDSTARIWNLGTGKVAHELAGHRNDVVSAAFSHDGRLVVTASRDHDARTWDAATGRLLHVLLAHFGQVNDASFSSDDRWIVTAGPATAGLWDADSGRWLLYLSGHLGPLTSASFTGSRTIVTSSADGTVRDHDCEFCVGIQGLLSLAEMHLARSGRVLSPEERARYLNR